MYRNDTRPIIIRILSSWTTWTVIVLLVLGFVAVWTSSSIRDSVAGSQAQFVADNVRRSAVQCYAIEGSYPSAEQGVKYLEDNYGLAIDHKRYLVYYDSIGSNLVPQIRVVLKSAGAESGLNAGPISAPSDTTQSDGEG